MKTQIDVIACQHEYAGIGFMKSRKSDDKIMNIGAEMIAYGKKHAINLVDIVHDDGSGIDVDRTAMDKLIQWMEKDFITVVLVRSVFEITTDKHDLQVFLRKAESLGVSVHSMEHRCNPCYVPWDGGDGC